MALQIVEGFDLKESIQFAITFEISESFDLKESIGLISPLALQIIEGFDLKESISLISPLTLQIIEGFDLKESIGSISPLTLQIVEGFDLKESIGLISPLTLQIVEGFDLFESIALETSAIPSVFAVTTFTLNIGSSKSSLIWNRSYEPWPIQRDRIRLSLTDQNDSLKLTLSNIKWHRSLGKLRESDYHGKIVKIWQGFLDINKEEINLNPLFEGEINRIAFNEKAIEIDLKTNAKYLSKSGLQRSFSIFCPFKFKDRQCGYIGSDSVCDKSYADCNSKGNTRNFGGFNTLLKIQGTRNII